VTRCFGFSAPQESCKHGEDVQHVPHSYTSAIALYLRLVVTALSGKEQTVYNGNSENLMAIQPDIYVTPEEYLDRERQAEYKSEYFAGQVVAMSGASREHNLIVTNIVISLGQQLKGRPCEVYPSNMRVKMPATGSYVYPDVVAVCGEPELEDAHFDTLLNPTALIEVLSPFTESLDRGAKAQGFRLIESLSEYLLVAQDTYRIEHYIRQPEDRWVLIDIRFPDQIIQLASINCELAVRDVYDKVLNL
jgi:Uma2 family endonuclease